MQQTHACWRGGPSVLITALGDRDDAMEVVVRLESLAFQPPPVNNLSFQQHSGYTRLSTCVFMYIPASSASFQQRSFVFIEIPASFRQKENSFFEFLRSFDPSDKLSD
jgi:hypothetical protein